MKGGKKKKALRRDGGWENKMEGGDKEAKRGSTKQCRRLRQAVHISWLPLIIRAFS